MSAGRLVGIWSKVRSNNVFQKHIYALQYALIFGSYLFSAPLVGQTERARLFRFSTISPSSRSDLTCRDGPSPSTDRPRSVPCWRKQSEGAETLFIPHDSFCKSRRWRFQGELPASHNTKSSSHSLPISGDTTGPVCQVVKLLTARCVTACCLDSCPMSRRYLTLRSPLKLRRKSINHLNERNQRLF